MLLIDDRLLLRALIGDRAWAGFEDLAVTYGFQYRAMVAALKPKPEGALSKLIYELSEQDREALRGLILAPENRVLRLDPRISLRTAAQVSQNIARLNQLQSELLGAAIFYDCGIAVATIPPNVQIACEELGIPFQLIA